MGMQLAHTARPRNLLLALVVALACACALGLSACGGAAENNEDQQHLEGVWQVQDTTVTVVFTEDKFKMVGNTYDYTIDTGAKTITYKNGAMTGTAKYSFSSDNNELTLDEDDGNGGTRQTKFDKVSDDTSAEPSANAKSSSSKSSSSSSSEAASD